MEERDAKIAKLEGTILRMKETPLGARECKRSFSATIETCAPTGRAQKRRITATRYSLEYSFVIFTCIKVLAW